MRVGWFFLAMQLTCLRPPEEIAAVSGYVLPYELLEMVLLYAGFDTLWGRWALPAVCRRFRDCTTKMRERVNCPALNLGQLQLENIINVVATNIVAAKRFFRDHWVAPARTNLSAMMLQLSGALANNRRDDFDATGIIALNFAARNLTGPKISLDNRDCLIHAFGSETRKLLNDVFRGDQETSCHQPRIKIRQIIAWLLAKLDKNLCATCFYDILAGMQDANYCTFSKLRDSGIQCLADNAKKIALEICARVSMNAPRPYDAKVFPRVFEFCRQMSRISLISVANSLLITFFEHLGLLQRIARDITTIDVDRAYPEAEMCKGVIRRMISHMHPEVIALYVIKNLQKFARKHPIQFLSEMQKKYIKLPFDIPVDPSGLGRTVPITAFFHQQTRAEYWEQSFFSPPPRKRARLANAATIAAVADDDYIREEKEEDDGSSASVLEFEVSDYMFGFSL